jgi:pilus assembly protein CpaE
MIHHKNSVSIKTSDPELRNQLEAMVGSAGNLRVLAAGNKERPDLLIFELSEKFDEEFKRLQALLNSNSVGEIFLTSKNKDTDLLLKTMKTGAKAFFPQPIDPSEVSEALSSFIQRVTQAAPPGGHRSQGQIIHVMGAKGGVGTTTVSVNLARILAQKTGPGSVALVDMNSVYGEVPLFLSLKPAYHWGEISKNIKRLDTTFLMNVLTRHPSGVHILPSPAYLNGHPPATPEIMESLLNLMRKTFDYVIIDGGQSLDGSSIKSIEMSEHVLLISLLSLPCLANTNKLLRSLSNVGIVPDGRVKIIINRFLKNSDISQEEAQGSVKNNIFWRIPNDYKVTMSAINQGKALCDISPKAPITRNLTELAESLTGSEMMDFNKNKKRKGFLFFK